MYGGRGIKLCDKWLSFEGFLEDMGVAPKGKSLDRIDVNGDYTADNCRWAISYTQQNNRRNNVRVTYRGVTKTIAQWARILNMKYVTLWQRLKNNESVRDAFETPVRKRY
jgi:hypothetical protein